METTVSVSEKAFIDSGAESNYVNRRWCDREKIQYANTGKGKKFEPATNHTNGIRKKKEKTLFDPRYRKRKCKSNEYPMYWRNRTKRHSPEYAVIRKWKPGE
jgi:hypothetical protein